jgi:ABC-type dipeptide/oligopeptide/nickel transport system ATPase subunit
MTLSNDNKYLATSNLDIIIQAQILEWLIYMMQKRSFNATMKLILNQSR